MNTSDISFVEVKADFDPNHLHGFVHLYQQAYNEYPYCEPYEENDEGKGNTVENVIQHVWNTHLSDGGIFLAIHDDTVVGLGCCVPMNLWNHDKEFQEFVVREAAKLPDDVAKICFMSEVCVERYYRHKGIGSRLVLNRVAWATRQGRFSHYMMRTAEHGSNSKDMYLKLGAWQVPNLIQDVASHADEVGSASKKRIFMAGKVPPKSQDFGCTRGPCGGF